MGMEMSGAVGDGFVHSHVSLKPLVQIAGLRNIDRNPTAIFGSSGIDINAGQRPERSVQGINRELIPLPGLPGPVDVSRRCPLRIPVTTE